MARALDMLPRATKTAPIIVRLSGHVQITDRLAIRELGRQIIEAEGGVAAVDEDEDEDAAQDEVSGRKRILTDTDAAGVCSDDATITSPCSPDYTFSSRNHHRDRRIPPLYRARPAGPLVLPT